MHKTRRKRRHLTAQRRHIILNVHRHQAASQLNRCYVLVKISRSHRHKLAKIKRLSKNLAVRIIPITVVYLIQQRKRRQTISINRKREHLTAACTRYQHASCIHRIRYRVALGRQNRTGYAVCRQTVAQRHLLVSSRRQGLIRQHTQIKLRLNCLACALFITRRQRILMHKT